MWRVLWLVLGSGRGGARPLASARAGLQRRVAVCGSAGIIGADRSWTAAMISVLSIPQVPGGDGEVGMLELSLDHE